jgi:hypothetical protein
MSKTLRDSKRPSLKDKILEQEEEAEKKMKEKKEVKLGKSKGRK